MKPTRFLRSLLLGSTLFAAVTTTNAQSIWSGASNDLWTNSGNWNTAPGSGAAVVFDGTGSNLDTTTNTAFTLNSLTFTSGQTSPVIINTTPTNSITFNPGTVLSVAAGNHTLAGTGSGSNRDLIFTGTAATDSYTFDIASGASFDIKGRIGQTGTGGSGRTYTKTGGGTLVFSVNNGGAGAWNFSTAPGSDGFLVSEGVLRFAATNAAGLSRNRYKVSSGAALELSGDIGQTFNSGTNEDGGITLNGTGIGGTGALRSISGNNNFNGTGFLELASNSAIGVDTGASLTVSTSVIGTGNLTKVGDGLLILSGANTFSGSTIISAGILSLTHVDALQNSALDTTNSIAGDATNGLRTDQTNLKLGGLIGDKDLADAFTTTSGGYGDVTAITLTTASGANHSYSGVIDGTRTLNVAGSGTQALSGNNSFDGGVNSSGTVTLALEHSNAAGTGTLSFATTVTGTAATFTLSGDIDVANNIVMDATTGRNTVNSISGSNTLSGDITINGTGNAIAIQNRAGNGTTFTIGGSTPNSTTITAADYNTNLSFRAAGGDTTAMGVINSRINAPNATFNINNDGFWTINSTGNSWAATTLSAGNNRIKLGANDALATGARLDMGSATSVGFVDLNGFNQTVAGLAGTTTSAQIKNDSTADSTLTLAGLTANRSFSGAITDGSGGRTTSLVMDSSGRTQTLSGTNTYTGTTLVSAGTLLINGSLGNSAVTVDSLAVIGGTGALAGSLSFAGDSFLEVVNLSDALAVTGTITFGSGFGIANLLGISWDDLNFDTPYTVLSTSQTFGETDIANFGFDNRVAVGSLGRQAYFTNGSLAVIVIPEPRAALLGGLGLLMLLRRRRG